MLPPGALLGALSKTPHHGHLIKFVVFLHVVRALLHIFYGIMGRIPSVSKSNHITCGELDLSLLVRGIFYRCL